MMNELVRENFLEKTDRLYKSLNRTASFCRAGKIDLNNPMDTRMLHQLSINLRGLYEVTDKLLSPEKEPTLFEKNGKK